MPRSVARGPRGRFQRVTENSEGPVEREMDWKTYSVAGSHQADQEVKREVQGDREDPLRDQLTTRKPASRCIVAGSGDRLSDRRCRYHCSAEADWMTNSRDDWMAVQCRHRTVR